MSWSVLRLDMWDQPAEVIGSFCTKEEAEEYASRSRLLGRSTLGSGPVSCEEFYAVPWTVRKQKGFH